MAGVVVDELSVLGIVGAPVAATRLAGREMVDAGLVMAAGKTEDAPWAAEATV